MRKRTRAFILTTVALMFFAVFFSAVPVRAANWQPVTTISGSDSKISDEFQISGSEWRINWSYIPGSQVLSTSEFSFFIFPKDRTTPIADYVWATGVNKTSGTLNIHEGPRLYYVKILTVNTPGYTLTVEYDADSVVSDNLLAVVIFAAIGVPIILIIVIAVVVRKRVKKRKLLAGLPPPPV
jgi:hypothetical protein